MLDFQAFCQDHGIPVTDSGHHHTHQGWLQTHCIFCTGGSSGWHLGFSLEKGYFNCWRCGGHGVWDTIGRLLRTTRKEEIAKTISKYDTKESREIRKVQPRKKTIKPPPGTMHINGAHRQYLRKRGFCPEALEQEWGIQGTKHLSGPWNWRIVFPIHDQEGRVVAWCGRSIDDHVRPKYKLSDDADILVDPRGLVYGLHKVKESVAIVEGPLDVWKLGPGAAGLLGMDWQPEQVLQLKRFLRRFVILDPNNQAQRQAEKLAEWLGMFKGSTEIISGLPCDPGDLPQGAADDLMKELNISEISVG